MQEIQLNDWATYKSLLSTKGMAVQYVEFSDRYELYAAESGIFTWRYSLSKGGADQTDFETNYKPTANAPLMLGGRDVTSPNYSEAQAFTNEAIRDTAAHNSVTVENHGFRVKTIIIDNTLNQSVSLQLQGSRDGTAWFNVGLAFDIPASTLTYQSSDEYFPHVRFVATCAVAPASGNLNAWIEQMGT